MLKFKCKIGMIWKGVYNMKKWSILLSVGLWAMFLFNLWRGSMASAGFCLVIAVCDTMLWINGQWEAKKRVENYNFQILQRTFGLFTWLASYGTLGILTSLVLLNRIVNTLWTARIMLWGIVLFLLWGLYLCFLVFAGKNNDQQ